MRDLLPTGVPSLIALANNPFFSTLAKYHLLSVQSHHKRANRIVNKLFQSFSREREAHLDMEKKVGKRREITQYADAIRLLTECNRVITEGAGVASVAASLAGNAGGGKIVSMVSGGNIGTAKMIRIFQCEVRVVRARRS